MFHFEEEIHQLVLSIPKKKLIEYHQNRLVNVYAGNTYFGGPRRLKFKYSVYLFLSECIKTSDQKRILKLNSRHDVLDKTWQTCHNLLEISE